MAEQLILSSIFHREAGGYFSSNEQQSIESSSYELFPLSKLSRKTIEIFGDELVRKSARIISTTAKENFLVTLNSDGHVVAYNLLSASERLVLTHVHEKALKALFVRDYLFLVIKSNSASNLKFFLVPIRSIQENKVKMIETLQNLFATIDSLKEIHSKDAKILIETNEKIEIWDIVSGDLLISYSISLSIFYKYSNKHLVFWRKQNLNTFFEIISVKKSKNLSFSIKTTRNVYFCHIVSGIFIIGILGHRLQSINLCTLKLLSLDKVPRLISDFEQSKNIFVVFQDGTSMINFNEDAIFNTQIFAEVFVSQSWNAFFFCDLLGKLWKFSNGKLEMIETGLVNIEQIGTNPDSEELYIVSQGKIFVYF